MGPITLVNPVNLSLRSVDLVYGMSGQQVNLKLHLEEIHKPIEIDDFWSQTDEFLVRAPTPPFVPAKTGIDAATQVEPWEVGKRLAGKLAKCVSYCLQS